MVDIDTIGAGGGSIAYVDAGGVFRVGPQSAGADPGPACYGRGGDEPTSTDAQLLLGRLRPDRGLLGGDMRLDRRARPAGDGEVAERLGVTVEEAALGALQIQKFGMTQAIELNSVRRGYDPREFTLVAAGGAGPLFACDIALELEIPRVLVPAAPGDHLGDRAARDRPPARVRRHRAPRAEDARPRPARRPLRRARRRRRTRSSSRTASRSDRRLVRRLADCRYAGQGYEVRFDVPAGRDRRRWVDRARRSVPPRARARVRPPVRRRDRDRQRPRGRHRADRGAPVGASSRPATATRRGAKTLEREVVFDVGGAAGAPRDALLRPRAAARRRPDRGPGDHRAVRLDDRDPARLRRRDRPLRQHRRRLHAERSARSRRRSWRRRS